MTYKFDWNREVERDLVDIAAHVKIDDGAAVPNILVLQERLAQRFLANIV